MPSLPRYDAQRQLTTQPLAPQATGAAEPYRIAQEGLKMAQNYAQAWDDARTTAQINAFKAQKGIFTKELIQNAQLDPDVNNHPKYFDQLKKWKANAFEGMSERAKQEARLDLHNTFQTTRIKLDGIFQQKTIVEAQKSLGVALDDYKHKALHPSSREEYIQTLSEAKDLIDRNVANRIISPKEGQRMWEQWQEELRQAEIDNAIHLNPGSFLRNVDQYTFKNNTEKNKAISTARTALKNIQDQQKIVREQTQAEGHLALASEYVTGSLDLDKIDTYTKQEMTSPTMAALYKEILMEKTSPLKDEDKAMPEVFLGLLDKALESNISERDKAKHISEIIEMALEEKKRKGLNIHQLGWFVQEAEEKLKGKEPNILKAAWERLSGWGKFASGTTGGMEYLKHLGLELIDRVRKGGDPEEAELDIIRNEMQKMLTSPEKTWATTADGRYVYTDDGENWFYQTGEPYK